MEKTIQILKDRTFNLFNDQWYEVTAREILTPNSKNEFGYIYIVRIGTSNKCKIGFSINITKRINSFRTTLGDNLVLDGFIYTEDYSNLEKKIHLSLSENNIHGEWFNLSRELSNQIINEYTGTLTLCNIDGGLIIEDGILFAGNKNASLSYKEKSISVSLFLEKIYSYMESKKITLMYATPKELYEYLFSSDNEYNSITVLRELKKNSFKPVEKTRRYNSFFDGGPKIGNPFIINLPNEA